MTNVVKFQSSDDKHKQALLELIDDLRERVNKEELDEIVCSACDKDGVVMIFVGARDVLGAIGLFTVGTQALIDQGRN